MSFYHNKVIKQANSSSLPSVLPLVVSNAYSGGMYDFAALPKSSTAVIELVYQILWQPPPAKAQTQKFSIPTM